MRSRFYTALAAVAALGGAAVLTMSGPAEMRGPAAPPIGLTAEAQNPADPVVAADDADHGGRPRLFQKLRKNRPHDRRKK